MSFKWIYFVVLTTASAMLDPVMKQRTVRSGNNTTLERKSNNAVELEERYKNIPDFVEYEYDYYDEYNGEFSKMDNDKNLNASTTQVNGKLHSSHTNLADIQVEAMRKTFRKRRKKQKTKSNPKHNANTILPHNHKNGQFWENIGKDLVNEKESGLSNVIVINNSNDNKNHANLNNSPKGHGLKHKKRRQRKKVKKHVPNLKNLYRIWNKIASVMGKIQ